MTDFNPLDMIIFSDLDGTLVDHDTYSFEAALPAISLIKEMQIPLILASSKTAAEIAPIREAMGFENCEAIVENGAGLLEKGKHASDAAKHYSKILSILSELDPELRSNFTGFSDWSDSEVADQTGLSLEASRNAKQRQYSEPGIWSGDEKSFEGFQKALAEHRLKTQRGGRFISISFGSNKVERMHEIIGRYARDDKSLVTIALGDAPNDIEMIETADLGVIVSNQSHKGIPLLEGEQSDKIIRTRLDGPAGWNEAVLSILNKKKVSI